MKKRLPFYICLLLIALIVTVPALAATNATYDLSWWTVDGGGVNHSPSGDYTLSGTAGQPDAGVASSGEYDLTGGFWAGIMSYLRYFLPSIWK